MLPPTTHLIVILGCAVHPGGVPSRAMRRRVDVAASSAESWSGVIFMPIGGVGRHPPAEADLMTELLRARGVAREVIIPVPHGRNTIESLNAARREIAAVERRAPALEVHVCTDDYHVRRCQLILRLWGVPTRALPCATSRRGTHGLYMPLRDGFALLKDIPLAWLWRGRDAAPDGAPRPSPGPPPERP